MQRANYSTQKHNRQSYAHMQWVFAASKVTDDRIRLCNIIAEPGSLYERAHQFHRVRGGSHL